MNVPARLPHPDLPTLFALFPPADDVPDYEVIAPDEMPQPYHGLLVHEHHMTVTLEAHHGRLVDVHLLACRHHGDSYARKIVLTPQGSKRVVLFGIVRIHLNYCTPAVRAAIVAGRTPLGRVLIQHNVLRRIELTSYLRVTPSPAMMGWFHLDQPTPLYGRLGYIHCDRKPAVELLEIVAPE